ncbi:hypothetical protein ElyMa_001776700, partial [Elysia marginata]
QLIEEAIKERRELESSHHGSHYMSDTITSLPTHSYGGGSVARSDSYLPQKMADYR